MFPPFDCLVGVQFQHPYFVSTYQTFQLQQGVIALIGEYKVYTLPSINDSLDEPTQKIQILYT